jgi:hypothetical protein
MPSATPTQAPWPPLVFGVATLGGDRLLGGLHHHHHLIGKGGGATTGSTDRRLRPSVRLAN